MNYHGGGVPSQFSAKKTFHTDVLRAIAEFERCRGEHNGHIKPCAYLEVSNSTGDTDHNVGGWGSGVGWGV